MAMRVPLYLKALLFLLYASAASSAALLFYPERAQETQNNSPNKGVCGKIRTVTAEGDVVVIKLNGVEPNDDFRSNFALKTQIFGEEVFFPLNSSIVAYKTSTKLGLRFYLPAFGNYSAKLFCSNSQQNIAEKYHSLKPHITRTFKIDLEVSHFDSLSGFSRLKCYGRDWRDRWCEGRNIAFYKRRYFFSSPAVFHFPSIFIIPGSRGFPFDKKMDRFENEPYVVHSFPDSLRPVKEMSYLYGTFYNYHMLWHVIFDFILPLIRFFNILKGKDTKDTRRVFVRTDGVWQFDELLKPLSSFKLEILDNESYEYLFLKCIIGIDKPEDGLHKYRGYKESILFKYNFNSSSAPTIRNEILQSMDIKTDNFGPTKRRSVLIIDRETPLRALSNPNEIAGIIRETCDFCDVQVVKFQYFSVKTQLEMVSTAAALIGVHGGGLTHVMWMHPSTEKFKTHLIEILPYMYVCRNWYNTAADVARVEYHTVMNQKRPLLKSNESTIKWCFGRKGKWCPTYSCHDLLRDQNTTLEVDTFKKTWLPIVESIRPK